MPVNGPRLPSGHVPRLEFTGQNARWREGEICPDVRRFKERGGKVPLVIALAPGAGRADRAIFEAAKRLQVSFNDSENQPLAGSRVQGRLGERKSVGRTRIVSS